MPKFGSPTELLGEFSRIEIDALSFEEASIRLNQLAAYVDNVELPLRGAARIARDDMKERFETETAPDGSKWFELDPDYAARKEHDVGFSHPILTRDEDLKNAATKQSAWTVAGDSIWFNTADLPEYWHVHQEGSPDFGAAFHMTANPDPGASSSAGLGVQNIPPRPFIGLSEEAEDKILELFDIWFSNGLAQASKSFAISSVGTLHVRTALGRFGERIIF